VGTKLTWRVIARQLHELYGVQTHYAMQLITTNVCESRYGGLCRLYDAPPFLVFNPQTQTTRYSPDKRHAAKCPQTRYSIQSAPRMGERGLGRADQRVAALGSLPWLARLARDARQHGDKPSSGGGPIATGNRLARRDHAAQPLRE